MGAYKKYFKISFKTEYMHLCHSYEMCQSKYCQWVELHEGLSHGDNRDLMMKFPQIILKPYTGTLL